MIRFIIARPPATADGSDIPSKMNRELFARKLVESPNAERRKMLARNRVSGDAELARSLQNICYEVWTNEPQKVSEIAAALDLIAEFAVDSDEVKAFAEWTQAIEHLVKGELKKCVRQIDKSENSFVLLGKTHHAATTQISKLYALALLGRYDEALDVVEKDFGPMINAQRARLMGAQLAALVLILHHLQRRERINGLAGVAYAFGHKLLGFDQAARAYFGDILGGVEALAELPTPDPAELAADRIASLIDELITDIRSRDA